MRDAVQINAVAMSRVDRMREIFNEIGEKHSQELFAAMTEEEVIAAAIFFTDMMLRNPAMVLHPGILLTMRTAMTLALEHDPIGEAFREMISKAENKPDEGNEQ